MDSLSSGGSVIVGCAGFIVSVSSVVIFLSSFLNLDSDDRYLYLFFLLYIVGLQFCNPTSESSTEESVDCGVE